MQDYIHRSGERGDVAADGGTHAALDAVADDGVADGLGHGEPDARGWIQFGINAGRAEPAHLAGTLPATIAVDALVVSVFAQAVVGGGSGGGHGAWEWLARSAGRQWHELPGSKTPAAAAGGFGSVAATELP